MNSVFDVLRADRSGAPKGPTAPPVYNFAGAPDITDPATFADGHPFAAYARMRAEAPVLWCEQPEPYERGFWALSRHEDIAAVSKDPETWSSAKGSHLLSLGDPARVPMDVVAPIIGNMVSMDPPDHTTYRRIALPGFTPARVAAVEPRVRARAIELIEAAARKSEFDFLEDIAQMLPLFTLAEILGVPEADRPKLLGWANALSQVFDPLLGQTPEQFIGSLMELFDYGRRAMESRRENPTDDVLSAVANARLDTGESLPPFALEGFFLIMIVGGNDTTRNTLAGGLWAFTQYPEQRARLLAQPDLLGNAVDEMLRHVSPVVYFARRAKRDVVIRGQQIPAGDKVVMLYGSANRDEAVFADAEAFDVTRSNARQHLSMGIGQHYCLGGRYGQMQLRVFFEELLRRYPQASALAPPERVHSNFILGVKSLRARFA